MKLAVIFLHKIEFLEDLLTAFLEIGVTGATILNSININHIISQNIPIFAGLREAFAGSSPLNKIILIILEPEMIERVNAVLEDVCSNPDGSKGFFLAALPIEALFGFPGQDR
jgi:nitrogen regulatory protein P-II 1